MEGAVSLRVNSSLPDFIIPAVWNNWRENNVMSVHMCTLNSHLYCTRHCSPLFGVSIYTQNKSVYILFSFIKYEKLPYFYQRFCFVYYTGYVVPISLLAPTFIFTAIFSHCLQRLSSLYVLFFAHFYLKSTRSYPIFTHVIFCTTVAIPGFLRCHKFIIGF